MRDIQWVVIFFGILGLISVACLIAVMWLERNKAIETVNEQVVTGIPKWERLQLTLDHKDLGPAIRHKGNADCGVSLWDIPGPGVVRLISASNELMGRFEAPVGGMAKITIWTRRESKGVLTQLTLDGWDSPVCVAWQTLEEAVTDKRLQRAVARGLTVACIASIQPAVEPCSGENLLIVRERRTL